MTDNDKQPSSMPRDAKIFVAGFRGLVGSALVRLLRKQGYKNLLLVTSSELDLRNQQAVNTFFKEQRPHYVFVAAARVGGIHANDSFPAEFIYDNLMIECNVINAAWQSGVDKLLFLGSSCIYPRLAPQPMTEDALLTGALEPTNQWYAIAKIAGIKLCQAYQRQYGSRFISVMPTNLYGPNDNFDLETSHVLPAMMRKFHEAKRSGAKEVPIWGSGKPRREFLHVDDLAAACVHLMNVYESPEIINIGCGEDITIRDLAGLIRDIIGFEGEIVFDASKPDGSPRKLLDVSKIRSYGWNPSLTLEQGIRTTYDWFLANEASQ